MADFIKAISRIVGNTGTFFIASTAGSVASNLPSLDIVLWITLSGFIISTSKELIEYGKRREKAG